jgi:hypothetical protein
MPLLVLFIYGIFLAVQWPLAGKHLFGYISFSHKSVDTSELVIPQKYISNKFGYDGQFYYRLALDPFSNEEQVQGIRFDNARLRQQRILLPVLTWVIAGGDPELTAIVMLVINLLAVAGITIVGGALLCRFGLSPWPALLLAFYPGFAISIERFLSEPLSCLLLLLSLLSLSYKKVAWGGVILVLAVLARETALVAALGMAGMWFLQSMLPKKIYHWKAPGPVYWLPAIVTYICWQIWLQDNWSSSTYLMPVQNKILVWPFIGIVTSLERLLSQLSLNNIFFLFMMFMTFLWSVVVALVFRGSQGPYRWIWLAYLAVVTLFGVPIWDNSPSFLRTTTELNVIGLLVYMSTVRSPHRLLLIAWLGCWLLSAGAEGYRLFLIDQARAALKTDIVMEEHLEYQFEPRVAATLIKPHMYNIMVDSRHIEGGM